jgi:cyclic pyranopterin phosphate synthase
MSVNYLRISVTDRCNLRCVYCNPLGGCGFIGHKEILSFEEIQRIVRLLADVGIRKVRLTGGEPLVRKGIVQLVRQLSRTAGIEEVTLTTNGVLLGPMAAELKAAGARRVNVSVDSAERENYRRITGFDLLPEVTGGIYKAIEVGLTPVKINSVIIKDINVSQILPLAEMSVYLPVAVRYIEYCPTDRHIRPGGDGLLSAVQAADTDGPALYFRAKNSAGTIGFISGRSSMFCQQCNRLRLTSDGKIRPCLYSACCYDVRKLIRGGADDATLRDLLGKILHEKSNFTKSSRSLEQFSMQKIGG